MSLFKRQKSRQRKLANTDAKASDATHNVETDNVLNALSDMPITEHLIELRKHLIKICVAVLIVFLALVGFSRELYNLLSDPLVCAAACEFDYDCY